MDINNILGKIDAYKVATDKAAEEQREAEVREIQQLEDKIKLLKPNIENIIKVYRHAVKNGIKFNYNCSTNTDVDKVHSSGDFVADSFCHRLGLILDGTFKKEGYYDIKDYLGIRGGGACGDYDFITNGDYSANKNRTTKHETVPTLSYLRRFVNEFPIFESDFYAYIEKKTEIKPSKKGKRYYVEVRDYNGERVIETCWFDTIEQADDWFNQLDYFRSGDYFARLFVSTKLSEETNDYETKFVKYLN